MAKDLFGGLGGLMKGLSSIIPQDDPAFKMVTAQTEVSSLQKQEQDLYAEIGKKAVEIYGVEAFGNYADKLRLVQSNLAEARAILENEKAEQEAKEQAQKAATAAVTCPSCGYTNAEGTKFCQECGTKLGATKRFCVECGAELAAGIRFCGECGARQPE